MDDECESVTEAKSMSAKKKKIDVLGALAKYQQKKEEEKLLNNLSKPVSLATPEPVKKQPAGNKVDMYKEINLGITEFVDQSQGFSAILKQRYSDFHVHEINMEGQTVVLTDQTLPEPPVETAPKEEDCLTAEEWKSVEDMMASDEKKVIEIDVTAKSKEERVNIHKALRSKFKDQIASNSAPVGDKTIMKIFKHASNKKGRWTGPPYLEFVLYKENLSTLEAISIISRKTQ